MKKNSPSKKKGHVSIVETHIKMTFNNIHFNVTDPIGNTLAWSSGGKMGFKGSRKSTPHAANLVVKNALTAAHDIFNFKGIKAIKIVGICPSRDAAIRAVFEFASAKGLAGPEIIIDKTPVPHNGCRPPKKRRV